MDETRHIATLGGREWLALPEFAIACIEARIDPAATVSRLHAVDLRPVEVDGEPGLEFRVYPIRGDRRTFVGAVALRAPGRAESAVRTLVTLGTRTWPIELELVAEEPGGSPMLLAAAAMGCAVDPGRSFLAGPPAVAAWPPARAARRRFVAEVAGGHRSL